MALFADENGYTTEVPDEYDPKTGKNIAIDSFIEKAKSFGKNVIPVQVMQDKAGKTIQVPLGQANLLEQSGFKTLEQSSLENKAKNAQNKLESTSETPQETEENKKNPNYVHPNKTDTFWTHALNEATLNTLPKAYGAGKAVINTLTDGKDNFGNEYETNKNAAQYALNASERENPNTALGGKTVGNAIALASGTEALKGPELGAEAVSKYLPEGFIRNSAVGGAQSGVAGVNEAGNKNEDLGQTINRGSEQALSGTLGTAAGSGINTALGSLYKGTKKVVPELIQKDTKNLFKYGVQGEDYNNPNVREVASNAVVQAPKDILNTVLSTKRSIGAEHGNIIKGINEIDHTPLMQSMLDTKSELENLYETTGMLNKKLAIENALERLNGNIEHLEKTPNNAETINEIKKDLAEPLYDKNHDQIPDYGVREVLKPAHVTAQKLLESKNKNLSGVNKGYKAIIEADNPESIFDKIYPTAHHIEDIGRGESMGIETRERLNNLKDLNEEIKNNPDISQDIKDNLDKAVQSLHEIGRKGHAAKTINNSHGTGGIINRVVNSGGDIISNPVKQTGASFKSFGGDIVSGLEKLKNEPGFEWLTPKIIDLAKKSPDFAQKILKTINPAVGETYGKQQ